MAKARRRGATGLGCDVERWGLGGVGADAEVDHPLDQHREPEGRLASQRPSRATRVRAPSPRHQVYEESTVSAGAAWSSGSIPAHGGEDDVTNLVVGELEPGNRAARRAHQRHQAQAKHTRAHR